MKTSGIQIKGSRVKKSIHVKKQRMNNTRVSRRSTKAAAINSQYNKAYDNGYNNGYHDATVASMHKDNNQYNDVYDIGFDAGRSEGYRAGLYDGGDVHVDASLPHDVILPELTIQQIIATGLDHLQTQFYRLQTEVQIKERIQEALDNKQPLSIIRLGDGELLTLAHDLVLSNEDVKAQGPFLRYAGVEIPNIAARNALAQSVRLAHIVGIPKLRVPNYLPLVFPVFEAHGIDYRLLQLTFSTINYMLHTAGMLSPLLRGRRVIVIGNQARQLSQILIAEGLDVVEPVEQVHGVNDIARVLDEVSTRDFDIALVSAGLAAVMIAEKIATLYGKVALDFGHLANGLVEGETSWNS